MEQCIVTLNNDGDKLYFMNMKGSMEEEIDLDIRDPFLKLQASPDGKLFVLYNFHKHFLQIYDAESRKVIRTIFSTNYVGHGNPKIIFYEDKIVAYDRTYIETHVSDVSFQCKNRNMINFISPNLKYGVRKEEFGFSIFYLNEEIYTEKLDETCFYHAYKSECVKCEQELFSDCVFTDDSSWLIYKTSKKFLVYYLQSGYFIYHRCWTFERLFNDHLCITPVKNQNKIIYSIGCSAEFYIHDLELGSTIKIKKYDNIQYYRCIPSLETDIYYVENVSFNEFTVPGSIYRINDVESEEMHGVNSYGSAPIFCVPKGHGGKYTKSASR